ncbi:hypothetical protein C4544_06150 [candidate division WS5 bacterium]|jgi:hypothetical protein|uniref:Glycosyltransferase RgtA/B/C/D-like domain-containing protein n=1 Tax=candidate division WS5 bacterium TaxID=2093353 RepID=A0A419DAP0_9BACT|nr:MAG: hypothetical protein C4544_06150 [candidate division WS5 bacterium]
MSKTAQGSTMIFLLAFTVIISLYVFFGYLNKGWIFGKDAQLYYMVGRSLYFDHDVDFTNEWTITPHPEHLGEPRLTTTGRIANQFPIGYAIISQPFFLISDICTRFCNNILRTNLPNDGYRGIYGFLVPFSSILLACIGIYFSFKIICQFFSEIIASLSISTVVLSTSLLWYVTGHLTMSHAYSFFVVTAFINASLIFFDKRPSNVPSSRYVLVGSLLSLAVMVRLQNLLFVTIPLISISVNIFKNFSSKTPSAWTRLFLKISLASFSFLIYFIPQLLFWKTIYGTFFINPYATVGQTFKLLDPYFLKTLLSTNHGLFLWHPITLFSCMGLSVMLLKDKRNRIFLLSLTICFLFTWYIIATWNDFSLANSFGNRGFDGSTLFFALGWAQILYILNKKKMVIAICLFFVLWNVQLLFQQRYLGWLPYYGKVSHLQVFLNYKKLPFELERLKLKYF